MEDFSVETTFPQLERKFKTAPERLKRQIPKFWNSTANYMQQRLLKGFQREVTPMGQKWAALSPLTLKMRRQGRKGSKRGSGILKDSGDLMKRATSRAARTQIGPTRLKIAVSGVAAVVQQVGARMRMGGSQAYWMALRIVGVPEKKKADKKQQSEAYPVYTSLVGRYLKIPARKYLGFSREDPIMIARIWTDWFAKAWGK